jgi:nitroreductase
LKAHHNSCSYKADPIPEEFLEAAIESARRAQTSTNSYEISLVVVRNVEAAHA